MKYKFVIAAGVAALAACGTVTQMEATGGSRSDGIVKLSFEYDQFDRIELDEASALQTARQRCAVWGYTDADPFQGVIKQCQGRGLFGECGHWFVTREYQCTMGGQTAMMQTSAPMAPPLVGLPPMATAGSSGPRKVRAKTASGYCLDVPENYVGTGATNSPVVTSGMPRCDQLSARGDDSSPPKLNH